MRKPRFIAFHVGEGAVRGDVDTRNANSRPGVFKHVAAALVAFVTVVALAVPTAYAVTATNSASSSDDSTIQVDSSSSSDADATDNSTSTEDVESAENVASTGDADSADNADATVDDSADSTADDSNSDSSVVANEDGSSTYSASVSSSNSEDADEIHVSVVVPSGAFTEDVSLSVSLVDDDAIVDELESSEISGDSYLGLDISFVNTDGVEIEPSESVDVTINVPGSVLGDDVDTSSLSVLHFVEDENGNVNSVDTVADTSDETDGTITVDSNASTLSADSEDSDISDATVTAEFSVDSFSTFTITWSRYFEVTIHYVDQNGNEINGTQSEGISISSGSTVIFADYNGDIDGYSYSGAYYKSYTGDLVTKMVASSGWVFNYLTFYNETEQIVDQLKQSWSFNETKADVYLVYVKDDDTSSDDDNNSGEDTTTKNATVTANKTAKLNDDGTYDLTLSITGDRGSEIDKAKLDVLFILDESGSMKYSWSNGQNRITAARNAIAQIVGYGNYTGLSDNDKLDVQYALVGFSGSGGKDDKAYNDATTRCNWTDDPDELYGSITTNPSGGTNYEAGIRTGKNELEKSRSNAQTVVIFISDGNPGYYYNSNGITEGTGRPSTYNSTALEHAVNELKTLDTDYFYFVGITDSVGSEVFRDMVNAVNVPSSNKGAYTANSADELLKVFEEIAANITFFAAEDVTISDQLSEYADMVLADGSPQFTITVTHGEQPWVSEAGESTLTFRDSDGNDVTLSASYNEDTRTITLDFPDGYELEEGYTYSISTVITASDAAKRADPDSDAAKQEPDPGTGTHADSNEKGFFSNGEAKVTFTANDETGSVTFPKPVIQVQTSSSTTVSSLPLTGGEFTPLMLLLSGTALAIIGASIWLLSRRRLV